MSARNGPPYGCAAVAFIHHGGVQTDARNVSAPRFCISWANFIVGARAATLKPFQFITSGSALSLRSSSAYHIGRRTAVIPASFARALKYAGSLYAPPLRQAEGAPPKPVHSWWSTEGLMATSKLASRRRDSRCSKLAVFMGVGSDGVTPPSRSGGRRRERIEAAPPKAGAGTENPSVAPLVRRLKEMRRGVELAAALSLSRRPRD